MIAIEQYLDTDRAAEVRSEFFRGEMFAAAAGNYSHNLIVANLLAELRTLLRGRGCGVTANDVRVQVSQTGLYTYPDVVVVCGERQFRDEREDTLLNPTMIAEVLSTSTEAYDRGAKFAHYRTLSSLRDYLLVSSDRIRLELFSRQPGERWMLTTAEGAEATLDLPSLGCALRAGALYESVDLPAEPAAVLR